MVHENIIPSYRGHLLNKEDKIIRKHILNLMCHFTTSWAEETSIFCALQDILKELKEFEKDALLEISENSLLITKKFRPFVRNICMVFDLKLQKNKPKTPLFSMTV